MPVDICMNTYNLTHRNKLGDGGAAALAASLLPVTLVVEEGTPCLCLRLCLSLSVSVSVSVIRHTKYNCMRLYT